MRFIAFAVVALVGFSARAADRWELVADDGRTKIVARNVDRVREIVARRVIDVPASSLAAVAADVQHYTDTIPYTTKVVIVAHDHGAVIAHQRMEMPFLQAREYVVAVESTRATHDGHATFTTTWRPAPSYSALLDARAVRVDVNDGAWTFEELADGKTLATFRLHVDPAGDLPPALVDVAQRMSVGDYLDRLERRARTQQR